MRINKSGRKRGSGGAAAALLVRRARALRAERRARPSHDRARDGDARTRGEAAHGDEGAPSRRAAPRDPSSRGTPAPSAPSLTPPSSPPVRAGPVRSAGEERRRGRPRVEPGTRDANGAPHAASPRPRLPSPPPPPRAPLTPLSPPHPPALVSSLPARRRTTSPPRRRAWRSGTATSCETGTSSWPSRCDDRRATPVAFRAPPARSPDPPPLPNPLVRF